MKLKSLELFGFKSFAERTVFDLEGGVTAIVGPNGCGKSNTVDAVKWALGEQRARSLRGREMTDIIFNGSATRPAMDVCEVTLNFDNSDGVLHIEQTEVAVTRRIFRSGESEYLINNQSCRLRDVRELFMGTGLGPGGYSFMEQGKIDSVLASNPVERRKVFEEAAGISRYRARRHETELKLDKVDANLLRLADIIDELERRERSLKIQAGKARRYHELSSRARELQAQVALYRYDLNATRTEELGHELAEVRERRAELTTSRDELRRQTQDVEVELTKKSESLLDLRESAADLAARTKSARDMVEFHGRHLEELESRAVGREKDIGGLELEVENSLGERQEVAAELEELVGTVDERRAAVEEARQAWQALRDQANAIEENIRETDVAVQALSTRHVEVSRAAARVDAEERRWTDDVETSGQRREGLETEAAELAARRDALVEQHRNADAALQGSKARQEEAKAKGDELEQMRAQLVDAHRQLVSERSRVASRIEVLEGHVNRKEGLDSGVKTVLDRRKSEPSFLPGCRGLLVDLFRADLSVAEAVEAALGELTQAVVVETVDEALQGATWLEEMGKGRAAFLPLAAFAGTSAAAPFDLVCEDARVASALGVLLDGVEVLDSDAVAAAMRSGAPLAPVIVTPRGGIVRHGRVVVAGRRGRGHGLVALRSELEALRLDGAGLEERTATAEAEVQRVAAEHQTIRTTIKELRDEVQASERATLALDHEVGGLKRQLERIAEERDRLVQRAADASARLEQLAVEREQVQTALAELDAQLEETRATRESTHEERSRRRVQSDEAARGLEALRVDLVTTEQRIQGLTSSERHLADRHDKAVQSIARFRADLTDFAGDRERSKESLATERARVEELGTELASRRGEIGGHEEEVAEVRGRHEELVSALRAVETELEAVGEALHGADMRLNEVRVNQENLVQRIRNELELELAEMHEEYAPADVDWDAVEAELTEAREKIGRLGNVNLAAIDDLTEVEERLEFLVAQRNDLQHSKQQLSRVLNDIEAESTRLFLETFKAVREHFQVLFRKLFGGGKADISLVDETNVLESGIEITARPPGKEMRSIIQLSGGERTLTAVALLFAIIRAHPCPCCLMDEVDAALDEDNTERFCLMLDEFLSRTQFILITHSRRTMARADVLFGVTMGERGVSRRVGVRFEDVREDGSIREGADAERPNDADRGEARVRKTPKEPGQNGNGNGNGNGASGKTAPPSVQGEVFAEIAAAAEGDGGGQTTGESTHRGRERGADVELEESAGGAD